MRLASPRSIRLAAVVVPTTIVSLLTACSDSTGPTEARAQIKSTTARVKPAMNDECELGRNSDGTCRGVTLPWY